MVSLCLGSTARLDVRWRVALTATPGRDGEGESEMTYDGRDAVTRTGRYVAADTTAERLGAISVLGILYLAFVVFARDHPTPVICPFRRLTGVRCPLCGFTTSVGELMRGNLRAATRAHPLGPLLIVVGGVWYLREALAVFAALAGNRSVSGGVRPAWVRRP